MKHRKIIIIIILFIIFPVRRRLLFFKLVKLFPLNEFCSLSLNMHNFLCQFNIVIPLSLFII